MRRARCNTTNKYMLVHTHTHSCTSETEQLPTPDAYLNDWGREFHGRDGVSSWNGTDNIGVQAHFALKGAEKSSEDTYVVTLTVSGNGYNGTGPMTFILKDGLIASLRIS
ncbi:nuclear transport factor 2 family protein [Streptomyces sp. NPDC055722]